VNISQFLAKLISLTHMSAILFLVFGFILPKVFLTFHIVAIILTVFQWKVNNNQCLLTQWQQRLEKKNQFNELEGHFTQNLMKKMGFDLNRSQLFYLIYGVLFLSLNLSLLRLFFAV